MCVTPSFYVRKLGYGTLIPSRALAIWSTFKCCKHIYWLKPDRLHKSLSASTVLWFCKCINSAVHSSGQGVGDKSAQFFLQLLTTVKVKCPAYLLRTGIKWCFKQATEQHSRKWVVAWNFQDYYPKHKKEGMQIWTQRRKGLKWW